MIGTSNWTPDYFLKTGGIGFIYSSKSPQNDYKSSSKRPNNYPIEATSLNDDRVRMYDDGVPNMHSQLNDVFLRDWNSPYSSPEI